MNENPQAPIPVHLLVLDVAGTAMLGFGIFLFSHADSALARALPSSVSWLLMALGALQAVPATVLLARFFIGRRIPK